MSKKLDSLSLSEIEALFRREYRSISAFGHILLLVTNDIPSVSAVALHSLTHLEISANTIDITDLSGGELDKELRTSLRQVDTVILQANPTTKHIPLLEALRIIRGKAEDTDRKQTGRAIPFIVDETTTALHDLVGRVLNLADFID